MIQASFRGYGADKAATVFGLYNNGTGILAISRVTDYRPTRFKESVIISNFADEREMHYTEELMREAVAAFFDMQGGRLITFADGVMSANPGTKIEPDGVDERGTKYRFAPDISNSQIAVIAMCLYAQRAGTFSKVEKMYDDLEAMQSEVYSKNFRDGEGFTI